MRAQEEQMLGNFVRTRVTPLLQPDGQHIDTVRLVGGWGRLRIWSARAFRAVGVVVVWTLELMTARARWFFGLSNPIPPGAEIDDEPWDDVPLPSPISAPARSGPPPIPPVAWKEQPEAAQPSGGPDWVAFLSANAVDTVGQAANPGAADPGFAAPAAAPELVAAAPLATLVPEAVPTAFASEADKLTPPLGTPVPEATPTSAASEARKPTPAAASPAAQPALAARPMPTLARVKAAMAGARPAEGATPAAVAGVKAALAAKAGAAASVTALTPAPAEPAPALAEGDEEDWAALIERARTVTPIASALPKAAARAAARTTPGPDEWERALRRAKAGVG
jgi:hypothetical protein